MGVQLQNWSTKLEFTSNDPYYSLTTEMQLKKRLTLAFPFKKGSNLSKRAQTCPITNLRTNLKFTVITLFTSLISIVKLKKRKFLALAFKKGPK